MMIFDSSTKPMFDSIIQNLHENERLAELRDSILPRLMSGDLDVSVIEA
jgi:type I restriction enzyme S subunit